MCVKLSALFFLNVRVHGVGIILRYGLEVQQKEAKIEVITN